MSACPTPQQLEELMRLGAATIHEAQGQRGALDSGVKPIDPGTRLAGPALTVDARPADNLIIHYALTKARPGDVLVVDAKGFSEGGAWGDLLTLAAQRIGIAGLVIDGAVRDAAAISAMNFPVFTRHLSIKGTNKHQPGHINTPVNCGGVTINAGDVIVGDRDGVVTIAADDLEIVIDAALQREVRENEIRASIHAGRSTVEILNLAPALQRLKLK